MNWQNWDSLVVPLQQVELDRMTELKTFKVSSTMDIGIDHISRDTYNTKIPNDFMSYMICMLVQCFYGSVYFMSTSATSAH